MPAELSAPTPLVTADQLDLVKRTVADGATADELRLYLFDCARQGVHPLDKLLHFTKRGGKYTPITSIDFMRQRAAETGEYAGNDDPTFVFMNEGERIPDSATATVWRLVQGTRCAFTATARWMEYKPETNDFMWRKMPHTMLGKCAEALALRKGFPRQLAGLYVREEMDQAGQAGPPTSTTPTDDEPPLDSYDTIQAPPAPSLPRPEPPAGTVKISRIDSAPTKTDPKLLRYRITLSSGAVVTTIKSGLASLARVACEQGAPVRIKTTATKWGDNLDAIAIVDDTGKELPF